VTQQRPRRRENRHFMVGENQRKVRDWAQTLLQAPNASEVIR